MFDPAQYESLLQLFYASVLRPGDVAVDVGAHSGLHTLPMATSVGPSGRVYAFEPLPGFAESLRAALIRAGLADRVIVSDRAVSDSAGESTFQVAVDRPQESGIRERNQFNGPTRIETIRVTLGRLDDLVPTEAQVRFVKIDVEGAEFNVLRGADRILSTHQPVVAFEFGMNSADAYGVNPGELYAYLAQRGYVIGDIRGNRLDQAQFVESAHVQQVWDYVALPVAMAEGAWFAELANAYSDAAARGPAVASPPSPLSPPPQRRWWRRLARRLLGRSSQ